jgi:hypothetical protein
MKFLHRRSALSLGLFLWLGFIPSIFLVPRIELFEVLDAIIFSVWIGVVIGFAPGVWEAVKQPIISLQSGDALQIGVLIGGMGIVLAFGVLWWWRLTNHESGIIDHAFNAFSRWIIITAGFMHLAAAGSIDGYVPLKSYLRAGALTGVGVMLGTIVVMFVQAH